MSFLTARIVKKLIFFLEFTLSLLKKHATLILKDFQLKIGPQSKDGKSIYHVRQILTLFGN